MIRIPLLFTIFILLTGDYSHAQNSYQPISVKPIPEGKDDFPIETASKGKVFKALQVIDKTGYTNFYLTKIKAGKFGENFTNALFGFAELNDHGGYAEQWSFKQYNQSSLQGIDFENIKVEVKDMDKDGYAEYYILYYIYNDGMDADQWKLLIYTHNKKYLKRYYVIKQMEEVSIVEKEEADDHSNQLPQSIRLYADSIKKAAAITKTQDLDLPAEANSNKQGFFKNAKPLVTWNSGDNDIKTVALKNGGFLRVKFDRYHVNVYIFFGSEGYSVLNIAESNDWEKMQITEFDFDKDGQNELVIEYGDNAKTKCKLLIYKITHSGATEIGNIENVKSVCSFDKNKIILTESSYILTKGKFMKAD